MLIPRCSLDVQLREDAGFCWKLLRAGRPGRPCKRGSSVWGKAPGGSRWHPESRLRQLCAPVLGEPSGWGEAAGTGQCGPAAERTWGAVRGGCVQWSPLPPKSQVRPALLPQNQAPGCASAEPRGEASRLAPWSPAPLQNGADDGSEGRRRRVPGERQRPGCHQWQCPLPSDPPVAPASPSTAP